MEEHVAIRADLERNLDGHLQESKQALRSAEGSSRRRRQRAGQREAEEPRRPWARSDASSGSDSDTPHRALRAYSRTWRVLPRLPPGACVV